MELFFTRLSDGSEQYSLVQTSWWLHFANWINVVAFEPSPIFSDMK